MGGDSSGAAGGGGGLFLRDWNVFRRTALPGTRCFSRLCYRDLGARRVSVQLDFRYLHIFHRASGVYAAVVSLERIDSGGVDCPPVVPASVRLTKMTLDDF